MGKNKLLLLLVIPLVLACMLSQPVGADNEAPLIIRVGAYENHPKIYTDSEGNIAGIFPDILTYIASQERWHLKYVHGTWSECLKRLETNEIDLMVDVGFSEERAEKYNFTNETVFVNWGIIYGRKGLDIQSFTDLQDKRVAVMQGSIHTTGKDGIKNLAERFDVNPVYVEVSDYYQVFELLDNKEVDAGVVNRIFGSLQENTYDVVRTTLFFNPTELRFAMPKDSTPGEYLAGRIDHHMIELKNDPDSIYYQSLDAYLGIGGEQAGFVPKWLLVTLAAIVGFAVFLLSAVAMLRRSVNRRTAELRHNEEKYRGVVERANDGICIIQDIKIVYANPRAQDIFGYTPEEVIGTSIVDHIHPDDIARVLDYYKRRMSGEDVPSRYESAIMHKDGSRVEVDFNVGMIQYEGKIAELVIVRDITERKHATEALQESEERLRIMFESVTDGITVTDLEGVITGVNTKLVEIHGANTKDDILGKNALQLIANRDHEEATTNLSTALEGGTSGNGRYSLLTLLKMDGSEFLGEIGASVLKDASGKPVGFIGITRDITERKQAEEKIRHAAEEWRVTFDSIADPISIQDRDFRILRVNNAYAETFNKKPAELIGKTCYELVHGATEPVPDCPYRQTLETKKPITTEFFEPHLGIHLQVSISPIFDIKGEVVGSVHMVRDISERKKMQEQLIVTDRLASVGELAAGVAHELNNPLTSVIGFSQLLMEQEVPDDVKKDLTMINKEAQRTATIVKNLLTFGRKHSPVKESVNINSVIEKVLELRAYEHRVRNIEVITRFAPDLPEIMADYFQLQQVFINIIINAEHFMIETNHRGTLIITTENIDNVVRASFADDGPGIAKEDVGHLFDPFFTIKEVGKGTGLGLSICHGIITEHGGKIYAKSELGKGATFVVELPINEHSQLGKG